MKYRIFLKKASLLAITTVIIISILGIPALSAPPPDPPEDVTLSDGTYTVTIYPDGRFSISYAGSPLTSDMPYSFLSVRIGKRVITNFFGDLSFKYLLKPTEKINETAAITIWDIDGITIKQVVNLADGKLRFSTEVEGTTEPVGMRYLIEFAEVGGTTLFSDNGVEDSLSHVYPGGSVSTISVVRGLDNEEIPYKAFGVTPLFVTPSKVAFLDWGYGTYNLWDVMNVSNTEEQTGSAHKAIALYWEVPTGKIGFELGEGGPTRVLTEEEARDEYYIVQVNKEPLPGEPTIVTVYPKQAIVDYDELAKAVSETGSLEPVEEAYEKVLTTPTIEISGTDVIADKQTITSTINCNGPSCIIKPGPTSSACALAGKSVDIVMSISRSDSKVDLVYLKDIHIPAPYKSFEYEGNTYKIFIRRIDPAKPYTSDNILDIIVTDSNCQPVELDDPQFLDIIAEAIKTLLNDEGGLLPRSYYEELRKTLSWYDPPYLYILGNYLNAKDSPMGQVILTLSGGHDIFGKLVDTIFDKIEEAVKDFDINMLTAGLYLYDDYQNPLQSYRYVPERAYIEKQSDVLAALLYNALDFKYTYEVPPMEYAYNTATKFLDFALYSYSTWKTAKYLRFWWNVEHNSKFSDLSKVLSDEKLMQELASLANVDEDTLYKFIVHYEYMKEAGSGSQKAIADMLKYSLYDATQGLLEIPQRPIDKGAKLLEIIRSVTSFFENLNDEERNVVMDYILPLKDMIPQYDNTASAPPPLIKKLYDDATTKYVVLLLVRSGVAKALKEGISSITYKTYAPTEIGPETSTRELDYVILLRALDKAVLMAYNDLLNMEGKLLMHTYTPGEVLVISLFTIPAVMKAYTTFMFSCYGVIEFLKSVSVASDILPNTVLGAFSPNEGEVNVKEAVHNILTVVTIDLEALKMIIKPIAGEVIKEGALALVSSIAGTSAALYLSVALFVLAGIAFGIELSGVPEKMELFGHAAIASEVNLRIIDSVDSAISIKAYERKATNYELIMLSAFKIMKEALNFESINIMLKTYQDANAFETLIRFISSFFSPAVNSREAVMRWLLDLGNKARDKAFKVIEAARPAFNIIGRVKNFNEKLEFVAPTKIVLPIEVDEQSNPIEILLNTPAILPTMKDLVKYYNDLDYISNAFQAPEWLPLTNVIIHTYHDAYKDASIIDEIHQFISSIRNNDEILAVTYVFEFDKKTNLAVTEFNKDVLYRKSYTMATVIGGNTRYEWGTNSDGSYILIENAWNYLTYVEWNGAASDFYSIFRGPNSITIGFENVAMIFLYGIDMLNSYSEAHKIYNEVVDGSDTAYYVIPDYIILPIYATHSEYHDKAFGTTIDYTSLQNDKITDLERTLSNVYPVDGTGAAILYFNNTESATSVTPDALRKLPQDLILYVEYNGESAHDYFSSIKKFLMSYCTHLYDRRLAVVIPVDLMRSVSKKEIRNEINDLILLGLGASIYLEIEDTVDTLWALSVYNDADGFLIKFETPEQVNPELLIRALPKNMNLNYIVWIKHPKLNVKELQNLMALEMFVSKLNKLVSLAFTENIRYIIIGQPLTLDNTVSVYEAPYNVYGRLIYSLNNIISSSNIVRVYQLKKPLVPVSAFIGLNSLEEYITGINDADTVVITVYTKNNLLDVLGWEALSVGVSFSIGDTPISMFIERAKAGSGGISATTFIMIISVDGEQELKVRIDLENKHMKGISFAITRIPGGYRLRAIISTDDGGHEELTKDLTISGTNANIGTIKLAITSSMVAQLMSSAVGKIGISFFYDFEPSKRTFEDKQCTWYVDLLEITG